MQGRKCFFFIRRVENRSICTEQSGKSPPELKECAWTSIVHWCQQGIPSMMAAEKNGQLNQHRKCEGNLEDDPSKRKCTPSHFCRRSFIRETDFTECSYVDVVVLEFSSNQSSMSVWSVITCAVEKSTYIPCSNAKWDFCFLYFYFFSCYDCRVRLSDERGYPSRLKVSRRYSGGLFYSLPQMWWAVHP